MFKGHLPGKDEVMALLKEGKTMVQAWDLYVKVVPNDNAIVRSMLLEEARRIFSEAYIAWRKECRTKG